MSEAAPMRRLHPATLVGSSLRLVPQAVGGMAAYGAVVAEAGLARVLMFAAFGAAIAAGAALLGWWRFGYRMGADEIVIQSGVLSRQRRVIPLDRVQDISIEQGPLARLFGTARVRVETGGSEADEGTLDSIELAEAHRMRDVIRSRNAGPAGASAEEQQEAEEPLLFRMSLGRVLLAGLFNFSLFFLAAIFAALNYLEPVLGPVWDAPRRWLGTAEEAAGRLTLELALLLGLLLLLLGVASGVLRTLSRDFGFRLTRTPAGLRRRRGLFTLSEVVIPIPRVQVAAIESGLGERLFGWFRLQLQTLGAGTGASGRQVAAPFARQEEIAPILAELRLARPPDGASFVRSPRRAMLRRAFLPLLLAVAAATAAAVAVPPALAVSLFFLLAAVASAFAWRRHAYLLDRGMLYVKDGLLTRRLWLVPIARAQTISIVTSPVQRALGLASVLVDTAGAATPYPRVRDLHERDARVLASHLLHLFNHSRQRP